MTNCPHCNGLGGIQWRDGDETSWETCEVCNGTGLVTEKYIYESALSLWGEEAQLKMAIEEMAELIVKLVKLGRFKNGSEISQVIEEIADVEIMMAQLRLIFGGDSIDEVKKRKLARLFELVRNG
jgi:hypothetical protein